MKTVPCYWWKDRPNFGDALMPIILANVFGVRANWYDHDSPTPKLFGVGSILHLSKEGDSVWGSGLPKSSFNCTPKLIVNSVRGPLTAECIISSGVHCPSIYGDPALLLPRIFRRTMDSSGIGLVPHWSEVDAAKKTFGEYCEVVSPLLPPKDFIAKLTSCEVILSSSLHGLVAADAYGIPSQFVRLNHRTDADYERTIQGQFKFDDYRLGVGREPVKPKLCCHASAIQSCAAFAAFDSPKCNMQQLIDAFPFND